MATRTTQRLAPAERQPDEHGDRDDGDEHVPEELVRLVRRRLAVVARDRDVYVPREEVAAHGLNLVLDFACELDRVHALALCDRQRDGRIGLPAPGMVLDVVSRLARRRPRPWRHLPGGPVCRQPTTRRATGSLRPTRSHPPLSSRVVWLLATMPEAGIADVGGRERLLNGERIEPAGRERRGIELDGHLTRPSADDRHFGDAFGSPSAIPAAGWPAAAVGRSSYPSPQSVRAMTGTSSIERDCDNGRRRPRRQEAGRGAELLVQPHQRALFVFADEEAGDDHRSSGSGRGVEILDAGHLPEHLLDRARHSLLDLRGRGARHVHDDVNHRDDDLRLLLAGQGDDRVETEQAATPPSTSGVSFERVEIAARRPARPSG